MMFADDWNTREDRRVSNGSGVVMADGTRIWYRQTRVEWDGVKCLTTMVLMEDADGQPWRMDHGRIWPLSEVEDDGA